jgi:hypothetical protein
MNTDQAQARARVAETFPQPFNKGKFLEFTRNLLNKFDETKAGAWNTTDIKDTFKDHVRSYERLGTYTSPENEKLDVLIVHLTTESKLGRARTAIRNFVADHLKERDNKDAALVAFVSPTEKQWRFSYVKMEYAAIEKEDGKVGVQTKLTPARRFSYIVGKGESCHTAQSRFLDLLQDTENYPTLAQIEDAFSVEAVTKEFFREIANWYFWALKHVRFPEGARKEADGHDHISVIRLITRLIFCWFIKEKRLIPADLFDERKLAGFLKGFAPGKVSKKDSVFYKAILQNLFFATLNMEMEKRGWRINGKNFMAHCLYRHRDLFAQPSEVLDLFKGIPFLNGGLFECLDKSLGDKDNPRYERIDGFSDRADSQPMVPDFLFFGEERELDLSEDYGDKKFKKVKVRGLIHTLNRYNFTIEENTPLDQEVALDPELSGKVFENLLAAYNPETGATARKQTGSFYTPREIVSYMVDEALIAYLKTKLEAARPPGKDIEPRLRHLFAYNDEPHHFTAPELDALIAAIDNLKALDPAVGSGAFPMGILHKLVFILGKLDPRNEKWKERQVQRVRDTIATAEKTEEAALRERTVRELELQIAGVNEAFERNELDYGRKLYLIENCIYGVDIQPIAVQIAKMRFFISLIVDQKTDPQAPNLGVRPLPNLETKFVAANSLIGIERPDAQGKLFSNAEVGKLKSDLTGVRHQMFTARTPSKKRDLRERDKTIRLALAEEIRKSFVKANHNEIHQIRLEIEKTGKALEEEQSKPVEWEITRFTNLFGEMEETRFDKTKEKKRYLREQIKALESNLLHATGRDTEIDATANQLAAWDPYDQNLSADFFDPEWMFGFNDGFDVVIGNPPYVEHKKLKEMSNKLSATYDVYSGTADLYIYFFEKGLRILADGGLLTFISSNKYFKTRYGTQLRGYLSRYDIQQIIDFNDIKVFDALVASCITQVRKATPSNGLLVCIADDELKRFPDLDDYVAHKHFRIKSSTLTSEIWQWGKQDKLLLKSKIEKAGKPLSSFSSIGIYRGVTTGYNPAFVVDDITRQELVREDRSNREVIKPLLQGRHIRRWNYVRAHEFLLFVPWHFPLHEDSGISGSSEKAEKAFRAQHPVLYKHLSRFKKGLSERNVDETGVRYEWYALQRCAASYHREFEKEKIIWGLTADKWAFAYDTEGHYLPSNGYILTSGQEPVKYILAIMNSKVMEYYFGFIGIMTAGGAFTLKHETIAAFPLVEPPEKSQKPIIALVDEILAAKKRDAGADVSALEREIDELVYALYGLTPEEIKLVEERANR